MHSFYRTFIAAGFFAALSAVPAAATVVGSLAFSDGTDDFFSEVNPLLGDTFDVEFNPFALTFVTTQDGVFRPPFDGAPVQGIPSSAVGFAFVSGDATTNFVYQLASDLVFEFNNGTSITFGLGTQFQGMFDNALTPTTVEFDFLSSPSVSIDGIGMTVTASDVSFGLSDTSSAGGGTYGVTLDATTPGSQALALLAVGSLLVARRRSRGV